MKPSLQLRIGPSLTMTPQLQQAIRLLQLSSMELQIEIQEALESNMMLELDDSDQKKTDDIANGSETTTPETDLIKETDATDNVTDLSQTTIPDELPVDSGWDTIYDNIPNYTKNSGDKNTYDGFENQPLGKNSLREHLAGQLNLLKITDSDKVIAITIIDSLNDDGYLNGSLEDILAVVAEALDDVDIEEVAAVLSMIQGLGPPGVGARDIKECLSLQLKQYDVATPRLPEAERLITHYLDLLAAHDYKQLMRKMKLDRAALTEVITLIQSMNPRPGNEISDAHTEYIMPDVYVKKVKGVWKVDLNTDGIPNLRVNATYTNLIRRADNSNDNASLKSHLQEARWFIKSIRSRSETLLRVATCIVERQRAFLEYGTEAMKPLVLHDVADALGMHESTISRVTTRKYIHTPRGIFELKYFFSSHVGTNYGGTCSSTAIRALIKKLIITEMPEQPLSDSKIATILKDQGINVARRTVAKYREEMALPPSNKRKRLA